jgi:hypothetical protein
MASDLLNWRYYNAAIIMTLDQITKLIKSCAEQMNSRYGRVVFDEWAVVSFAEHKARVLAYAGPRREEFLNNFVSDAGSLRAGLISPQHEPGDFEFARHGVGTTFESYMVLGQSVYVIWNNTVQSMDGIAKDPHWLGAQVPFADLSEKVQADPVTLAARVSAASSH